MHDIHPLDVLSAALAAPAERFNNPLLYPRLSVVHVDEELHVEFFGAPFEEAYAALCERLVLPDVASCLASLVLRAPDEGHNGTCNWSLGGLVEAPTQFPRLRYFSIEQNQHGSHNRRIIGEDYDEAGTIAGLLRKSPALDALVVPSAPDGSFFEGGMHPLRYLSVDAGYDTQAFIKRLAQSNSFPGLRVLEFGEYCETYMEDFTERCTPLSDYELLFRSPAFQQVASFTWRNPVATASEIARLRALIGRRPFQFTVVRYSSEHVRVLGS